MSPEYLSWKLTNLMGFIKFKVTKQDKLNDISDVCVMSDMIHFEDMDKDGRLGLNEFYAAFSKLYSKYEKYKNIYGQSEL